MHEGAVTAAILRRRVVSLVAIGTFAVGLVLLDALARERALAALSTHSLGALDWLYRLSFGAGALGLLMASALAPRRLSRIALALAGVGAALAAAVPSSGATAATAADRVHLLGSFALFTGVTLAAWAEARRPALRLLAALAVLAFAATVALKLADSVYVGFGQRLLLIAALPPILAGSRRRADVA